MEIKWNVLSDEVDELKEHTIEMFDKFGNIEGQFEIVFNTIRFGYVDNEVPFGNELLISWFSILNKAVIELKKQGYVIIYVPDTPKWLEIEQKEDSLLVSELELICKSANFLITDKSQLSLFNKTNKVDNIVKCEFINCILSKSKEFINYVCSINESLADSTTIKEIVALNNEAMG